MGGMSGQEWARMLPNSSYQENLLKVASKSDEPNRTSNVKRLFWTPGPQGGTPSKRGRGRAEAPKLRIERFLSDHK